MTKIIGIILLLVILRLAVKNFSAQLKAAVFGPPSLPKAPPPPAAPAPPVEAPEPPPAPAQPGTAPVA